VRVRFYFASGPGRRELNHHWVATITLRHGAAYEYVAGPEHFYQNFFLGLLIANLLICFQIR
jgi:hypothetical protein